MVEASVSITGNKSFSIAVKYSFVDSSRNGGYRYENSDGSAHYNNGHGFEEFRHPDRSRNWKRYPNSAVEPNMSGSGYDDDSESEVDRFVDGEGDIEMQDASYSIDEPDDDAPPP